MTKLEITEKSNSYKVKVIDCEQKISKYNNSIDTFSKFKAYLENSLMKVKDHKKFSLTFSLLCSCFSAIFAFVFLPISIILILTSIVSFERFIFFTRAENKFDHCVNYLSELLEKLSTKQLTYSYERDLAIEEIIKLEKAIPDVITTYLDTFTNNELNETGCKIIDLQSSTN